MSLSSIRQPLPGRFRLRRPSPSFGLGARVFDRTIGLLLAAWRSLAFVSVIGLALLATQPDGTLHADEEESVEEDEEEAAPPTFEGVDYVTTIVAPEESGLTSDLEASSVLLREQDKPPFSKAGLSSRVRQDREGLLKVASSQGYYQAKVDIEVGEGEPIPVKVAMTPGPRTIVQSFNIAFVPGADVSKLKQPNLADLGITIGQPAISADVIAGEASLINYLGNNGYPDASVVNRKVTVNLDTNEMQVNLTIDPGEYLVFGPLAIDGLERTDEEYIRRVLQWPEGQTFSNRRLETVRRRAVATNLFGQVEITRSPDKVEDGDEEPVDITLKERPPRTISLGAGFATDFSNTPFGFIGEAAWEHRNILGRGESLRLSANAQPDEQAGRVFFNKPNWLQNDQALQWRFAIVNEDQESYRQFSIESTLGVERKLNKNWTVYGGGGFKYLIDEDLSPDVDTGEEIYVLYNIPMRVTFDNRDDRLDATEGFLGIFQVAPTLVTVTDTAFYLASSLSGTHYIKVLEEPDIVLAGRAKISTLAGTELGNIPSGERLYAGGGGSVRGYEVDSLGPLDSANDAIGGRSSLEFGIEARWRFWDDYGLVPFLDAGQVYSSTYPDFSEDIQYAGGLGLRYYSPIGPIRLDFAAPINKRQRDRALQFYISIGQAF